MSTVPESRPTSNRNGCDLQGLDREAMARLALDRLEMIVRAMPKMRPRQQAAVISALAYAISDLAGAGVTL